MARRKHIKHALCIYQNIVITVQEKGKGLGDKEKGKIYGEGQLTNENTHVDVKQWLSIASGLLSSRELVSVRILLDRPSYVVTRLFSQPLTSLCPHPEAKRPPP